MSPDFGPDQRQVIELDNGFPTPESLDCAVVLVRAHWSGYSKASLTNLVAAFKGGLDSSWKLVILDTDTLDFAAFTKIYGPFPSSGGWGEAFWIKHGVLIHSDRGYYNAPLIKLLWERVREFSLLETLVLPDLSNYDSFSESVLKNCKGLPEAQLEVYERECREIQDLKFAVVTLYHINRSQAVVTLRALAAELQLPASQHFRLIVLNADAVSFHDMTRIFGEAPVAARTYWIRSGKIASTDDFLSMAAQRDYLKQKLHSFLDADLGTSSTDRRP